MRFPSAPLALLALAALLLPPAAGHGGEDVGHMNLVVKDVGPGSENEHWLEFEEGPLREGWVFLLVIGQASGPEPLTVRVVSEGDVEAGAWTLAVGEEEFVVNKFTTTLPETGEYRVLVANGGDAPARYAFYFDQSCNCAGKPLPPELPGMVLFNTDGEPGAKVQANFPEPAAVTIRVTAATLVGEGGSWPDDFRVVQVSDHPRAVQARADVAPVPIHELVLTFPESGRLYFVVEPIAYASHISSVGDIFVTPFYEPLKAKGSPAADAPLALLAVALAVALAVVRRRR